MPRPKKRSHFDSIIHSIIARATSEIVNAFRRDAPKPAGRPSKGASARVAPSAKPAKFRRRSSRKIAADNDKLLTFIKGHPGLRSEEIQDGVKLPRPDVTSGLVALRDSGRIKMKGVKRGATYRSA